MMVIALFGDSCTGKSTIAATLAQTLSAEEAANEIRLLLDKETL